jgi:hypothetical protein
LKEDTGASKGGLLEQLGKLQTGSWNAEMAARSMAAAAAGPQTEQCGNKQQLGHAANSSMAQQQRHHNFSCRDGRNR